MGVIIIEFCGIEAALSFFPVQVGSMMFWFWFGVPTARVLRSEVHQGSEISDSETHWIAASPPALQSGVLQQHREIGMFWKVVPMHLF